MIRDRLGRYRLGFYMDIRNQGLLIQACSWGLGVSDGAIGLDAIVIPLLRHLLQEHGEEEMSKRVALGKRWL